MKRNVFTSNKFMGDICENGKILIMYSLVCGMDNSTNNNPARMTSLMPSKNKKMEFWFSLNKVSRIFSSSGTGGVLSTGKELMLSVRLSGV